MISLLLSVSNLQPGAIAVLRITLSHLSSPQICSACTVIRCLFRLNVVDELLYSANRSLIICCFFFNNSFLIPTWIHFSILYFHLQTESRTNSSTNIGQSSTKKWSKRPEKSGNQFSCVKPTKWHWTYRSVHSCTSQKTLEWRRTIQHILLVDIFLL